MEKAEMQKIERAAHPNFKEKYYFFSAREENTFFRKFPLPHQFMICPNDTTMLEELDPTIFVNDKRKATEEKDFDEIYVLKGPLGKNIGFYDVHSSEDPEFSEALGTLSPEHPDYAEVHRAYEEYKAYAESRAEGDKPAKNSFISRRILKSERFACPTIEEDGYYIDKDTWVYLVRNYMRHIPTLLVGPTGSSKTTFVEILAKKAEVPLHIHDMGAMSNGVAGLLGTNRLKNKETVFDVAPFVNAVQEKSINLFDELSRGNETVNNILLPCLDDRRYVPMHLAGSEVTGNVDIHREVSFFGTANIGLDYIGVKGIDKAIKDRFEIVEFDYLDPDIEKQLLKKRTSLEDRVLQRLVDMMNTLRNANAQGEYSLAPSTRRSIAIAELVKDGFSLFNACNHILTPLYEGSLRDKSSEKAMVFDQLKSGLGGF